LSIKNNRKNKRTIGDVPRFVSFDCGNVVRSLLLWNTLVESFPSSVIAKKFDFVKQDYLALELAT